MRIRTFIAIAVLSGGCALSAQIQTPPPHNAPPAPLDLSHEESLELENYQLKVKIIQMNAQKEYDLLTPQVQAYQTKVLAAHPDAKYRLDMGTLSWLPLPAPPPPPVADPKKEEKK